MDIQSSAYDLAGQVIGLAMKVHSKLGPGFLELIYLEAMKVELTRANIPFEIEKPLTVRYDGVVLGNFFADILIEGQLIIELKSVALLTKAHEVQLVNYLAATSVDDGLLLNFGGIKLEYRRKYRLYKPK